LKSCVLVKFILIFISFFISLPSFAISWKTNDVFNKRVKIEQRVIRPELSRSQNISDQDFGARVDGRYDKLNGELRLISGGGISFSAPKVDQQSSYLPVIERYIAKTQTLFGNQSSNYRLDKSSLFFTDALKFFKFKVYRDDLWIEDAIVDFRFNHGRLVQVVNRSYNEVSTDQRATMVGLSQVIKQYFSGSEILFQEERIRVEAKASEYQLVRVHVYEVSKNDEKLMVQLESATGRVFEVRDSRVYASGVARSEVYTRDWKGEKTVVNLQHAYLQNGDQVIETGREGNFDASSERELKIEGFHGPFVEVRPNTAEPVVSSGVFSGGSWLIQYQSDGTQERWEDQGIAQPMAFYHGMKVRDFVKRFIQIDWLDKKLPIETNYASNCNAFWNGTSINLLNAGGDCAHSGLIADVIYHEWGHGLDHNIGGIADVAFSEGIGDVTSMLMTFSNILAPNFFLDGGGVRDLEPNKIYPDDRGEVHAEGLIIGTTLYDLFKTFKSIYGDLRGRDMLASLFFKSLFTSTNYTDLYEAFLVIDDDDGDLSNGTPNKCIFNVEFSNHGLAEIEEQCRLVIFDQLQVNEVIGNRNGYIEPGETVELTVLVSNPTDVVLSGLKATLSLEGVKGVRLSNVELDWDEILPGARAKTRVPVRMIVDSDVPCGFSFDLNIRLHESHRNLVMDHRIEVGNMVGQPELYSLENLPNEIPDASAEDHSIWVTGLQWDDETKVYDASIKFDVTHPHSGDVQVNLITPMGYDKKLVRGLGGIDDIHYDKNISQNFRGRKGRGIWTLRMTDWGQGDIGTLDLLQLSLTPANFRCDM
jgi:subtilisin-like proprotein convertase family protein